jgi:predicted dienelactone hydrolase
MSSLRAALLACFTLFIAAPALAQAPPLEAPAIHQVRVDDPGHAPIPVAIWAPAAGTNLPLVIISHGTGAGPLSHVDTARALAEAGFVVVAPMHPGDNFQDESAVGRPQWFADRSRHLSKVIDYMYGQWDGRGRLAPNRVGIFGFSAGATTALIAIGGEPDLGLVAPHCASRPEFVCRIMAPQDPANAVPPVWTHDRRIAAAVVAAPGLGFAFAPAGLAGVRVPVQLWAGSADETVPYETNTALVRAELGDRADFRRAEGAVHLSFLAPCDSRTPPALCQDPPGFDRIAFHRELNAAVVAFFRQHLSAAPPR